MLEKCYLNSSDDGHIVETGFLGELTACGFDAELGELLPGGLVDAHLLLELDFLSFQFVYLGDNEEAAALEETVEDFVVAELLLF